ncbi:hypothetical protein GCM10020331_048130 [Ectobacillus funiculus]
MVYAVRDLVRDSNSGKLNADDITEEVISSYLMTSKLPDPDLLIRTSGEIRISNFYALANCLYGAVVYRSLLARLYGVPLA